MLALRVSRARALVAANSARYLCHYRPSGIVKTIGYHPIRFYSGQPDKVAEKAPANNSDPRIPAKVDAQQPVVPEKQDPKQDPKEKPKLTIWQKVKKEAKHYWDGTKLLGYEIKVSFKLSLKMAAGHKLSRREDRQLKRTVQDIVRLVPFSVFILVPFAELLLPIALKIFPNMLPSTYESQKSIDTKAKKLSAERKKTAEFLRTTISGPRFLPEAHTDKQREQFAEFMQLVHHGEKVPRDLCLDVCHLFKDDVLLDNMSRNQLASMARYMNLQPFGTSSVLRYLIRHRLRQIKRDDYVIDREGVESLNSQELIHACRSRGFSTAGVSIGRLRQELQSWLQLRLYDRVPSSLLLLANTFNYGVADTESYYDALSAAIGALPDQVYHEAELEVKDEEATNEERLEVLKEQEDMINTENKEDEESGSVIKVNDTLDSEETEESKAAAKEAKEAKSEEAKPEETKPKEAEKV